MNNKVLVLALGLALSAGVSAQTTLYKLIYPNGKVEYSEKPPKDFPGKVIPLNVNPDANTAQLPKPAATGGETGSGRPTAVDTERRANRVKDAQARLESARQALKNAQDNPGDGDVSRVGKVGGGARPVFSDSYRDRLQHLEQAVKDAEDEVKRVEGSG